MNESDNKSGGRSGMGCLGFFAVLLGVAFIVLKLVGVIDWSWWWVLAPIWGYVALGFVIFFGYYGCCGYSSHSRQRQIRMVL